MSHSRKDHRLEIVATLIVLAGVLLVTDVRTIGEAALSMLGTILGRASVAVWIGFVLIGGGLIVLAWRMRVRFLSSSRWRANTCPKCGGRLNLIHRRWYDRAVGKIFLPHARRFRCASPGCRWSGLRHASRHPANNDA